MKKMDEKYFNAVFDVEKTTTTTSLPIRPRLRSNYNIDTFSDVGVVNARHLVAHWRTGSWTPVAEKDLI